MVAFNMLKSSLYIFCLNRGSGHLITVIGIILKKLLRDDLLQLQDGPAYVFVRSV